MLFLSYLAPLAIVFAASHLGVAQTVCDPTNNPFRIYANTTDMYGQTAAEHCPQGASGPCIVFFDNAEPTLDYSYILLPNGVLQLNPDYAPYPGKWIASGLKHSDNLVIFTTKKYLRNNAQFLGRLNCAVDVSSDGNGCVLECGHRDFVQDYLDTNNDDSWDLFKPGTKDTMDPRYQAFQVMVEFST